MSHADVSHGWESWCGVHLGAFLCGSCSVAGLFGAGEWVRKPAIVVVMPIRHLKLRTGALNP